MGINQVLSLVFRNKAKEGRTPLLNANNLPGKKDLAVGINGFEGLDLNGCCPKEVLVTFWKRAGFEGGERKTDLLVHAHCITSHFSLISYILFSVFFLIIFLFFYSVFFLLRECSIFRSSF